jgi:preprotein translocase subunit SecB
MADEQAAQPSFTIQRVYMKDASLEVPNAPQIFLEQEAPAVEVQLDVADTALADGIYEVTVTATVTTRVRDQIAFLVEIKQGGIFEIRGVPGEQIEPLLGVVCPSIVFPYLRSNIADLVTRAGFPPIHLAEINFEAFFQQRRQAAMAAQGAAAGAGLVNANGLPVQ